MPDDSASQGANYLPDLTDTALNDLMSKSDSAKSDLTAQEILDKLRDDRSRSIRLRNIGVSYSKEYQPDDVENISDSLSSLGEGLKAKSVLSISHKSVGSFQNLNPLLRSLSENDINAMRLRNLRVPQDKINKR